MCAALAVAGVLLLGAAHGLSRLLLGPLGGAAALGTEAERYRGFGNVPTGSRWWLAVDAPHTTTPLDLLATSGAALVVLGVSLLVASRAARRAGVLLAPLAAAGSMPLTLYTAHVVVLGLTDDAGHPVAYWLLQCVVALLFAALWRRLAGRGPVEAGLAALTRLVAGRAAPRSYEVAGSTLRPPRAWEQS